MSESRSNYKFQYSYWPGGSGDLSGSGWIDGYYYDSATGQFEGTLFGTAGPSLLFLDAAPADYDYIGSTGTIAITSGGTLSGTLSVDTVGVDTTNTYVLTGTLSVGYFDLASGAWTIASSGAVVFPAGSNSDVLYQTGGTLTVDGFAGGADTQLDLRGSVEVGGTISGSTVYFSGNSLDVARYGHIDTSSFEQDAGILTVAGFLGSSNANLGLGQITITGTVEGAAVELDGPTVVSEGGTLAINPLLDSGYFSAYGALTISGLLRGDPGTTLDFFEGNTTVTGEILGDGIVLDSSAGVMTIDPTGSVVAAGTGSSVALAEFGASSLIVYGALITPELDNFGTIQVDPGSTVAVSTTVYNQPAGIIIGNGPTGNATVAGIGSIVSIGATSADGAGSVTIYNSGTIEANTGIFAIRGNLEGFGTVEVNPGATLELDGSVDLTQTIEVSGTGPHTIILDDLKDFNGTITGLSNGDQIILPDSVAGGTNSVLSATIGQVDAKPSFASTALQIIESPGRDHYLVTSIQNIEISIANTSDLSHDYFRVATPANGTGTSLTLTSDAAGTLVPNSLIDMAVNGPQARAGNVDITGATIDGSGIKVGIISNTFNLLDDESADILSGALPTSGVYVLNDPPPGTLIAHPDEGRAMAQIIHAIAPGATIDFFSVIGDSEMHPKANAIADGVRALVDKGCNIIVDDWGLPLSEDIAADPAIDSAVTQDHITYVTAAGNDGIPYVAANGSHDVMPIYGHSADANVITVAAMNLLATPTTIGGYLPALADPSSSKGAVNSGKPDITAPVGGPLTAPDDGSTTFTFSGSPPPPAADGSTIPPDYLSLSPFFGTSAAAPVVAAVAALMMQKDPALVKDPQSVKDDLTQHVTPIPGQSAMSNAVGAGLVNAEAALAAIPCFLAGIPILTLDGERVVESLQCGDRLPTLSGKGPVLKEIVWIGRSRFDASRHPRPNEVYPIRITAGALDADSPHRDLLVSPGHSLLLDGVLMQAERLINGATIFRDTSIRQGEYYHVELADHDILLSAGVPSETYLDTGNRCAFDSASTVRDLYPDFSPRHWSETCVPLVEGGPALTQVRQRLIDRALHLGWRRSTTPCPLLFIAGRDIPPERVEGTVWQYSIPAGRNVVRLCSDSGVPAIVLAGSTDRRRLGLMVDAIAIQTGNSPKVLALDDPDLIDGWHDVERDDGSIWRWTDGHAALWAQGPCQLELSIRACLPRWIQDPEPCADESSRTVLRLTG